MERAPVRQEQRLVALAVVGLEVALTGLAVVDAQAGLAFDGQDRRPLDVVIAEGALGALVLPAGPRSSRRPATASGRGPCPISWPIPGPAPQLGQWPRSQRSSSRQRPKAATTGSRERRIAVQPRNRRRPGVAGAHESSPSRKSTTWAGARSVPRSSKSSAPTSPAGASTEGSDASRRTRATTMLPADSSSIGTVSLRSSGTPARNSSRYASKEGTTESSETTPSAARSDLRAELGDSPEVGVPLQPPLPGQPAQWPSLASGLGRSGMRRTPSPNRKIVAAISPTEIPHSTSDGR